MNSVRRSLRPWLLLLPAILIFVVFAMVPMLLMLALSFTNDIQELTLGNYRRLTEDDYYINIMARTIRVSAEVTALCALLGYPVAYHFHTASPRWRSALGLVIISPLLISVVIRTFGWAVILGSKGPINSGLAALGVPGFPTRLLYTEGAMIVGLVQVLLPFMILSIISALAMMNPSLVSAAENLGASSWEAFWRVTFPLSLPGVISGGLIVFTLSTSAFITPALLGGATVKVFSVLIYQQALQLLDWPFAAALVYVLLVISGSAVACAMWLTGKRTEAVVSQ